MNHRPPLPHRWEAYCAAAYLAPPLFLTLIPGSDVPYRDLVWLVTLVPAYLLSLQYGMRGAVAGLVMGTVLFTAIQFLVAARLDPEDWRITVPCYVAYATIAISVGWLSQQLHEFYERAMAGERAAVLSQLAIAIRHEVNNALATLLAEAQLIESSGVLTDPEDREALAQIMAMTRRVRDSVERLTRLQEVPVKEYVPGVKMADLARATERRSGQHNP